MKHARFTRFLLPWLWVALCPPLLNHCGGETEPGTETGNPPEIDERLLDVVGGDAAGTVELVGAVGAVSPGAVVSVTNLRTGARAEATATADGSLSVPVSGSLEDEYEVTVSLNGKTETINVSANRSGGTGGSGGGAEIGSTGTPSDAECAALEEQLGNQVAAGFEAADATCSSDADCQYVRWSVGCYSRCGASYLSTSGAAAARSALEEDTAATCSALDGCTRLANSPCPMPFPGIRCLNGTCQSSNLQDAACEDLDGEAGSQMRELLAGAERACTGDADCTLIDPSVSCSPDCGNPTGVASTASAAVLQSIDEVDQTICGQYAANACPTPLPLGCPPPVGQPVVGCAEGRCEVRLEPF